MFEVGDVVVHPVRGAGVVTDIKELQRRGNSKQYYKIRLLSHARTSLMIPVKGAAARGLRRAIKESRLNRVWHVLCSSPKKLPTDYEARHELLEHKLRSGDLFQVAEAMRDLTWRQQEQNGLTWGERQVYRRGIKLLAGEIAAAQGTGVPDAEAEVSVRLWSRLSPKIARWSRHRRI
jgi:CarD family transcriptional regulator